MKIEDDRAVSAAFLGMDGTGVNWKALMQDHPKGSSCFLYNRY